MLLYGEEYKIKIGDLAPTVSNIIKIIKSTLVEHLWNIFNGGKSIFPECRTCFFMFADGSAFYATLTLFILKIGSHVFHREK